MSLIAAPLVYPLCVTYVQLMCVCATASHCPQHLSLHLNQLLCMITALKLSNPFDVVIMAHNSL